jgi:hypothetical protein
MSDSKVKSSTPTESIDKDHRLVYYEGYSTYAVSIGLPHTPMKPPIACQGAIVMRRGRGRDRRGKGKRQTPRYRGSNGRGKTEANGYNMGANKFAVWERSAHTAREE